MPNTLKGWYIHNFPDHVDLLITSHYFCFF